MQDKKIYRKFEDEANDFASVFLLPEEQFIEECQVMVKKSNPDAYVDKKQKWLVSLQAIAIRAFKLDLIDYQKYRYFYMLINKKGYKVYEPLDDEITVSRPNILCSLFNGYFVEKKDK